MTDEQIKHMVDRFLNWRLPESFNPDGGIVFHPIGNPGTPHAYTREPSGTNLLDAVQADAMVRHMIDGMPELAMPTLDEIESAASAIVNARGARRGAPSIGNVLAILPAHLKAEVMEEADAALKAATVARARETERTT